MLQSRSGAKPDTPVGVVQRGQRKGSQNSVATDQRQPGNGKACSRCGKYPAHDKQHCPTRDATCRKWKKRGHFQAVRRTGRVGGIQINMEKREGLESAFLGAMEEQGTTKSDPWTVELSLNGKPVSLRIDTGAEVTVITESMWGDIGQPTLLQSDQTLTRTLFQCKGGLLAY